MGKTNKHSFTEYNTHLEYGFGMRSGKNKKSPELRPTEKVSKFNTWRANEHILDCVFFFTAFKRALQTNTAIKDQ